MRKLFFVFLFCISIEKLFAQTQAPNIQWQKDIGGSNVDQLYSIGKTSDGGFILGGYSKSNISGNKTENTNGTADYWIVKLDSLGSIQWQNTIGGNDYDYLVSVQQTFDGGYILAGSSSSDSSGDKTENVFGGMWRDYWVLKLDSIGNIEWQNTIGGSEDDLLNSIQQTTDGGYILAGNSSSDISGDKTEKNWDTTLMTNDYWVIHLNATGGIDWQNTIGGTDDESLEFIQQTPDGGFILGGESRSDSSGDKTENTFGNCFTCYDYWVVKLDDEGDIEWQNNIGGNLYDGLYTLRNTSNSGYILGGVSESNISGDKTDSCFGSQDYWVVKINSNGIIQWQKTFGGNQSDQLFSLQTTLDNGFILGGYSKSNISGNKTENVVGGEDCWIIKLDSIGALQWQKDIGGMLNDRVYSLQQIDFNEFILGGISYSNISGDKTDNCFGQDDYWVIKLSNDSMVSGVKNISEINSISLSPNPATTEIKIANLSCTASCGPTENQISLFNLLGRQVKSIRVSHTKTTTISVADLPAGIYVVTIFDGEKIVSKKLVKE